ncbi:MAG: hypothetical protein AB9860_01685 [Methanomassiliicoccales archaeon]
MADIGDTDTWMDILLDTVPSILLALVTLIIGYILAYVAGEMVKEVFSRIGQDRETESPGSRPSVMAGKIAKALVFAIAAILAIQTLAQDELFGDGQAAVEDYGVRFFLGLMIMFVGAFLSDIASSTVARWLHGGVCSSEETDPTKELVFLGFLASVVLVGLGIVLVNSLAVLLIFLAFLIIGVVLILMESRRKICRKV